MTVIAVAAAVGGAPNRKPHSLLALGVILAASVAAFGTGLLITKVRGSISTAINLLLSLTRPFLLTALAITAWMWPGAPDFSPGRWALAVVLDILVASSSLKSLH